MDNSNDDELHEDSSQQLKGASDENKLKLWHKTLEFLLSIHNYNPNASYSKTGKKEDDCCDRQQVKYQQFESFNELIKQSESKLIFEPYKLKQVASTSCNNSNNSNNSNSNSNNNSNNKVPAASKWILPIRVFILFVFTKSLIIACGQFFLLKHKYLVPRGYSQPWLSVATLQTVHHYLGNPLEQLNELSLLFYTAPPTFCLLGYILLPKLYARHPIHIGPLCFLLNPNLELKRIYLCIRQEIANTKCSLSVYLDEKKLKLIDDWKLSRNEFGGRFGSLYARSLRELCHELRQQISLEQLHCIELNKFLDELLQCRRRLNALKPKTYWLKHYSDTTAKLSAIVIGAQLIYILIVTTNALIVEIFVYKKNCDAYLMRLRLVQQSKQSDPTPRDNNNSTAHNCNLFDVYTRLELARLVEVALLMLLVALTASLNLILLVTVSINQVDLIESIKRTLIDCKSFVAAVQQETIVNKQLSSWGMACDNGNGGNGGNGGKDGLLRTSFKTPQVILCQPPPPPPPSTSTSRHSVLPVRQLVASSLREQLSGSRIELIRSQERSRSRSIASYDVVPPPPSPLNGRRLQFDKQLLEYLIKTIICNGELMDNQRSLTLLTYYTLYYTASMIALAILSAQFRLPESYFVRYFTMIAFWLHFNLVAILCAHIYSRIIKLERIMLLILASNAATFCSETKTESCLVQTKDKDKSKNNYYSNAAAAAADCSTVIGAHDDKAKPVIELQHVEIDNYVRCCTFATDLWIKFVLTTSANIERYCVRPLGIKLTYEKIIELNFFIIFVYSLSFRHN